MTTDTFISTYMTRKKNIWKGQKDGFSLKIKLFALLIIYILFLLDDISTIYIVNTKGTYYDFAYSFYPVCLRRVPVCLFGLCVLYFSMKERKWKKLNTILIVVLIALFIIQST